MFNDIIIIHYCVGCSSFRWAWADVQEDEEASKWSRLSTRKTRSFQINFSTIGRHRRRRHHRRSYTQGLPAPKAVFRPLLLLL